MANNISLIQKYGASNLDKVFALNSLTAILEASSELLQFVNAKTVLIPDIVMSGLADYSREDGYTKGSVTLAWTPYTLSMDRGRRFDIDSQDNEETAGLAFAELANEFERTKVVPEVDAYRLAKLFSLAKSENITSKAIETNKVVSELNLITKAVLNKKMSITDFILFVSADMYLAMLETTELQKKIAQTDYKIGEITIQVKSYNGMPIIPVPEDLFKSKYTFGSDGFTPTSDALDLNYLCVHRRSALPVKKHKAIKVVNPEQNQTIDGYSFYVRLYHDIFCPKNKVEGIIASTKPTTN